MADKSGITGPTVEQDDPTTVDEPSTPVKSTSPAKSFADVKAAMSAADDEPETEETEEKPEETLTEETPTEEPKDEPETPKTEEPTDTEPATDLLLEKQFSQRDMDERVQRAVDAVIKKERTREDSARQKLTQLELVAGMNLDKLSAQLRHNKVQALSDRLGIDETEARQMVEADEERTRLKAEREQMQMEREQEKKVNTYLSERNMWLADKAVAPDIRAFAQKYAAEIDEISDGGKAMTYAVARDYVLGMKMAEILKAREEAASQKTLASVQKGGTKAPAPATGKAPATGPVLTAQEKEIAHTMYRNMSKAEAEKRYAQSKAQLSKMRGQ